MNPNLAIYSYQFLRGHAHSLLTQAFPDKQTRYAWLLRNAPNSHMSRMSKVELVALIEKLKKLDAMKKPVNSEKMV